jgi:hypothetical protein
MTDQATAEATARQPGRPAPAQHDTLAVLAFLFGIVLWPLGIYLGHASCQEAVLAGRKRSALALAGMTVGYAAVSVMSVLFVSALVGIATGHGG